jgi:FkbM family methyltransferase
MISPWWDAGFAGNGVHGAAAQKQTMQAAMKVCKQRRRAIDVGAHIGIWSAFLATLFETVEAFEPVSENFSCLTKNVTALNVWPRSVALGDHAGFVKMERHGKNSGCWHAVRGSGVEICALDAYAFKDVDLIKIDVEGLEGRVLLGAEVTLHASKPVVVLENNGLGEKLYGEEWVDPKITLRKYGYALRGRVRKDEIWSC